ncbi:DUF2911 domain-containing protein [Algoriphagus sp. SE2]|uniref:DUF2911 domain-containing protein n=1 Tax=Algoriphagus sp. SE2 TaxID=3141536 RepID=UPI0031CD7C20
MFKKILLGLGILLIAFIAFIGYGMLFPVSPPTSTSFSNGGLDITVEYSQPSKKGRLIFGPESEGALQPYGKYWRLGANAATEIMFNQDVLFAGKSVPAGTYRMYAVPGADTFEISLNSEIDVYFGVTEPNYELDVAKVDIPVAKPDSEVEQFTISFEADGANILMNMAWDMTLIQVPISAK